MHTLSVNIGQGGWEVCMKQEHTDVEEKEGTEWS